MSLIKMHVKLGDNVKVISGEYKGKEGVIIAVCPKKNKIKVKGIALCTRHYKAKKQGEKSSIKILESFISVSNVMKV